MCNCGKKGINTTPAYQANQVYQQHELKAVQQGVRFKYNGATALTAIGNVTGRRYRFNYPDDIQLIDKQDAPAMRNVPVLQEL
jgi:hypothetical protein